MWKVYEKVHNIATFGGYATILYKQLVSQNVIHYEHNVSSSNSLLFDINLLIINFCQ